MLLATLPDGSIMLQLVAAFRCNQQTEKQYPSHLLPHADLRRRKAAISGYSIIEFCF
jgi:hypothetical protein